MRFVLAVATLAACGRLGFDDAPRGDARFGDDAPPVDARVFGPWSAPQPLTSLNLVGTFDDDVSLTADGLELYFNSGAPRAGFLASGDIFVSTRATTNDTFESATVVAPASTLADETRPMISADGLTLYFGAARGGMRDVYVSTRSSRTAAWAPEMLVGVGSAATAEATAIVVQGGLALYFDSTVTGNGDLYVATRATTSDPWGTPQLLDISDPNASDGEHWVSEDGLLLMFGSDRAGGQGFAIWEATRASTSDPFSTPRLVSELDTPSTDTDPFLMPDGATLYFASDRNGNGDADIFVTTRN